MAWDGVFFLLLMSNFGVRSGADQGLAFLAVFSEHNFLAIWGMARDR